VADTSCDARHRPVLNDAETGSRRRLEVATWVAGETA
jgi:hypothetical protein